MAKKFTKEALEAKTVAELRRICVDDLGITGMTKKRKDIIVDAILEKVGSSVKSESAKSASPAITKTSGKSFHDAMIEKDTGKPMIDEPVKKAEFFLQSTLTKPNAKDGDKTTTTIKVSAGASTGEFSVVGKTVGRVKEFLREVLNIDKLATGVVNGEEVAENYVLTEKDTLEYLKPAGRKGQ